MSQAGQQAFEKIALLRHGQLPGLLAQGFCQYAFHFYRIGTLNRNANFQVSAGSQLLEPQSLSDYSREDSPQDHDQRNNSTQGQTKGGGAAAPAKTEGHDDPQNCRDDKADRPNAYLELNEPVRARYIKYEHIYVASPNLAISDLRVFGRSGSEPLAVPESLSVRRDIDARNAFISWEEVPGAVGYNVRWGIQPEKLYQTYQVFADQGTKLELRALTVGQAYYVVVEAFNENGVSPLSNVEMVKGAGR